MKSATIPTKRLLSTTLLILYITTITTCQHFQPFQTGITSLQPLFYNSSSSTSTPYRTFTISPSNTTVTPTYSFIFSILSFSYFTTEAYCNIASTNQQPSYSVNCSRNVYKLAFMFFDKGPNVFSFMVETGFQQVRKGASEVVDISKWTKQVKFPMKSLVKKVDGTQYEVKVVNFLNGVRTFVGIQGENNMTVRNSIGSVKLQPFYANVTIDNETKLWLPIGVNVSTSLIIQNVSFYTLIVIREMISLNMNFETFSLTNSSGHANLSYFAGISQMSFYLPEQSQSACESISLHTAYNFSKMYFTNSTTTQKFLLEKITNYTKGSNLNVKLTKFSSLFYRRCASTSTITHYSPYQYLKEGKYYKISPITNPNLTWGIAPDGKLIIWRWTNIQSQKFYVLFTASNHLMIMNAATKMPIKFDKGQQNSQLSMAWTDVESKITWIVYYGMNNTNYVSFVSRSYSLRIAVRDGNMSEGNILVAQSSNLGIASSQMFVFTEVEEHENNMIGKSTLTTEADPTSIQTSSNFAKFIFRQLPEIWQTTNSSSSLAYSYYSIEQGRCYDRSILDSLLKNTSTNNFQLSTVPEVHPYWMEVNKSLSQATLSANLNSSYINTGSSTFAQGYFYGVCLNTVTLNSFFTQIAQGWSGFSIQNVSQLINAVKEATAVNESSSTNTTGNSDTAEEQLIQMPNGCKRMKIVNLTLLQAECEECKDDYTLVQPLTSKTNQSSLSLPIWNPAKCYCSPGNYMNSSGLCTSCSTHPTNCKPYTFLSASLQNSDSLSSKFSVTDSRSLLLTFKILSSQYQYQYLTSVEYLMKGLIVYVNGVKYNVNEETGVGSCDAEGNVSLCYSILVEKVLRASEYRVSIGTDFQSSHNLSSLYLLINETQQVDHTSSQVTLQTLINVSTTDTNTTTSNSSSVIPSTSRIYFTKLQTYEVFVKQPLTVQNIVESVEPIVSTLNKSSSVILLAAPFLMDKINIFSILQTNSLLYMMSFMKFDRKAQKESQVQSIAKKLFIFRPQPMFKLFSLKKKQNEQDQSVQQTFIQIPQYASNFQNSFLYNSSIYSSLSYPSILYTQAIPSIYNDFGNQNYMTLTLNSFLNMTMQILFIEALILLATFLCSTITEKNTDLLDDECNSKQIKKKIQFQIRRHKMVDLMKEATQREFKYRQVLEDSEREALMLEKRIEWQALPQITQCQKSTIIEPQEPKPSASMHDSCSSNIEHLTQPHSPTVSQSKATDPSIKQQLLFSITVLKQKRFIFYTSFFMIQLISQSYLLYFEVIKPMDVTKQADSEDEIWSYVDGLFGMGMMFLVMVFPVFLVNYEPLHLLKIVQVVNKFGGCGFDGMEKEVKEENKIQKLFFEKSYTYGEIFFHFCIIYYEIVIIPFSIAIGPSIIYQSTPILLYQLFKLMWMSKRLKFFDRIKIIVLCFIFLASASWDFIQQSTLYEEIAENLIIWGMYLVLLIEFAKFFKFVVVFILKSLRLKKEQNSKPNKKQLSESENNLKHQNSSHTNEISIMTLEQEPASKFDPNQTNQPRQFGSQKQMLQKKKQKLQTIKQKQELLKQISQARETLQSNLEYIKNRRRNFLKNTSELNNVEDVAILHTSSKCQQGK